MLSWKDPSFLIKITYVTVLKGLRINKQKRYTGLFRMNRIQVPGLILRPVSNIKHRTTYLHAATATIKYSKLKMLSVVAHEHGLI
jgi:hypothetical protein